MIKILKHLNAFFKGVSTEDLVKEIVRALRGEAGIALASIMPHLEIAYYYTYYEHEGIWRQVMPDTVLVRGKDYHLKVKKDCTLDNGDNSIQLKKGWNIVRVEKRSLSNPIYVSEPTVLGNP